MTNVIKIDSRSRCGGCNKVFKKTALVGRDSFCPKCWVVEQKAIEARRSRLFRPVTPPTPPARA